MTMESRKVEAGLPRLRIAGMKPALPGNKTMFENLFIQSGLSLERLRTFCLVAEHESFVRAATGDSVRQSQYSHQIAALEEFFGVSLFERRGRSLALTEAGKDLQRRATLIFKQLEEFKAQQSGEPMHLVIGAGISIQEFLLTDLLTKMMRDDPNLRIDVQNLSSNECAEGVRNYVLDLAIARPPNAKRGLQIHDVMKSKLQAAAAKEVVDKVSDRTKLKELAKLPTILLSGTGVLKTAILEVFEKAALRPNIVAEASSLVEVKKFVAGGLGISYLPSYCLTNKDTGLITWNVPGISSISRHLVLYYLKEKSRDTRFVAFVNDLVSRLKRI